MRTTTVAITLLLIVNQIYAQTETLTFDTPVHRVSVTGNLHVELIHSESTRLEILSGNEEDELDVKIHENTLELKAGSELVNSEAIAARLHYLSLSALEVARGGRVQCFDTLSVSFLELDVLNGGKVELYLEVDSLDARVNQGADIILYGKARSQNIDAYTWGNFLAYDLEGEDAIVKAATGAQVKVHVTGNLEASATSGAFVGYRGDPARKQVKATVRGEVVQTD